MRDSVSATVIVDYPAIAMADGRQSCFASMQRLLPSREAVPGWVEAQRQIVTITVPIEEWVTEQYLVRPASVREEIIPATYKQLETQVLVEPASKKLVKVPAEYELVKQRVVDKAAYRAWLPAGRFSGEYFAARVNPDTGQQEFQVQIPATFKEVNKRVLKRNAYLKEINLPARYQTVIKEVVDQPERKSIIKTPAEYKSVRVPKVIFPSTVSKRLSPESQLRYEWPDNQPSPVVCEHDLDEALITEIQIALNQSGEVDVLVDGKWGAISQRGLNRYARKNQLLHGPTGIALEVLESMGIAY